MEKRGRPYFQIYELVHPRLDKKHRFGFFNKKNKLKEWLSYRKEKISFNTSVEDSELDESLVKLINDMLELSEENLPQKINLFTHTNPSPFLNEYSFLKHSVRQKKISVRFCIDDTIKEAVEDAYKKEKYIPGEKDNLYLLKENEYYLLMLRDRRDVSRYNDDYVIWKENFQEWEGKEELVKMANKSSLEKGERPLYVNDIVRPEKPKKPWSISVLTKRTPGDYHEMFEDLGLLDYFFVNSEESSRKVLFEAGNIKIFNLKMESPSLKQEELIKLLPPILRSFLRKVLSVKYKNR